MEIPNKRQDPMQVHCYTNPAFCRQSEYIHEDNQSDNSDLPPPPQFQVDDLPPPPAVHQPPSQYAHNNLAFNGSPEVDLSNQIQPQPQPQPQPQLQPQPQPYHHSIANLNQTSADRYCYIDDNVEQLSPQPAIIHKRYGSLPMGGLEHRPYAYRTNRYEYIQDDTTVQVQVQQQQAPINNSRYDFVEQQQIQQRALSPPRQQAQPPHNLPSRQNSVRASVRSYRSSDTHYTTLRPDGAEAHDRQWSEEDRQGWNNASRKQINTPKGRYTSIPLQDNDEPPSLPERNVHETSSQRVISVAATQKLHEILTTPRKPRTRSQGDMLSPMRSPQQQQPGLHGAPQRNAFTPGCSPSSAAGHRAMNSSAYPQQSTPQSRALSPRNKGPMTSTPNKEPPSARRCLPLNESAGAMLRRHIEDSQAYGRAPGQAHRYRVDGPPPEEIYADQQKKEYYQGVESAFIARTAVVPPLSPPMSEVNTTLVSGTEKSDRKNAPLILVLVGILTCGLAIYLSWTQGRRYYFDSAIGCGACCTLAGACRNIRRAWTGLGLAGLAALSCAGLLLLAAKSPRPGTPLHDITAGALCGVSLLGAVLALLALLTPKCACGRHRRVHSWIPRFSP